MSIFHWGAKRQPTPTKPDPPATMRVRINVQASAGPADSVTVRLQTATAPDTWIEGRTDSTGFIALTVPASLSDTRLEVVPTAAYVPINRHEIVTPDCLITVQLESAFQALPRLRVRGQYFELETGVRWTAIENSDFALLNRWQHGEDIEPILRQRQTVGFNLLRVWTRYQGWSIGPGEPGFTDIDYARVGAFLDLCAAHGLYVELVGYAGTRLNPTDEALFTWPDDLAHWPSLIASIAGKTNVILEAVNEEDQPANRLVHLAEYQRPAGVLASHGSNGSERWPVQPPWSYETAHYNDAFEWWRKSGHNSMEIADAHHVPVIANENTRFCDKDSSIAHAYDAAAGAALLCGGSAFHSVQGKLSQLFTGATFDAACVWVAGAKSVDLSQQDALYEHLASEEGANDLRVYRRGSCLVRIRK